jgi:hypothetical protein
MVLQRPELPGPVGLELPELLLRGLQPEEGLVPRVAWVLLELLLQEGLQPHGLARRERQRLPADVR